MAKRENPRRREREFNKLQEKANREQRRERSLCYTSKRN